MSAHETLNYLNTSCRMTQKAAVVNAFQDGKGLSYMIHYSQNLMTLEH